MEVAEGVPATSSEDVSTTSNLSTKNVFTAYNLSTGGVFTTPNLTTGGVFTTYNLPMKDKISFSTGVDFGVPTTSLAIGTDFNDGTCRTQSFCRHRTIIIMEFSRKLFLLL